MTMNNKKPKNLNKKLMLLIGGGGLILLGVLFGWVYIENQRNMLPALGLIVCLGGGGGLIWYALKSPELSFGGAPPMTKAIGDSDKKEPNCFNAVVRQVGDVIVPAKLTVEYVAKDKISGPPHKFVNTGKYFHLLQSTQAPPIPIPQNADMAAPPLPLYSQVNELGIGNVVYKDPGAFALLLRLRCHARVVAKKMSTGQKVAAGIMLGAFIASFIFMLVMGG